MESEMEEVIKTIIEQFVDYLAPDLAPAASHLYLYLLRNSLSRSGTNEIRTGKGAIAAGLGKGVFAKTISLGLVEKSLASLEQKGCIKVGDTNRLGTLYTVILPKDIPLVAEKIAGSMPTKAEDDYFTNPDKRRELFERDKWTCPYCGEKVNQQNITLDHVIPQSKAGDNSKDNLKTCCLLCNGIKSGKTYEEAAPALLRSIRERRARSIK